MESPAYMTCALKIDTQTEWHKPLIKMLTSIDGVTYSIDAQQGIAYISGKVDPGKLLKMLAKSGKHAELCWVDSGQNTNRPSFNNAYNAYPTTHDNAYNNLYYTTAYTDPYNHHYLMQPEPHSSLLPTAPCYEPPAPVATVPFYEPEPKYFPQPPSPYDGFNAGDPQWCSIM